MPITVRLVDRVKPAKRGPVDRAKRGVTEAGEFPGNLVPTSSSSVDSNIACVASVPVQTNFSTFWPREKWGESKKSEYMYGDAGYKNHGVFVTSTR